MHLREHTDTFDFSEKRVKKRERVLLTKHLKFTSRKNIRKYNKSIKDYIPWSPLTVNNSYRDDIFRFILGYISSNLLETISIMFKNKALSIKICKELNLLMIESWYTKKKSLVIIKKERKKTLIWVN